MRISDLKEFARTHRIQVSNGADAGSGRSELGSPAELENLAWAGCLLRETLRLRMECVTLDERTVLGQGPADKVQLQTFLVV
jgi:hypothetical protein